MRVPKPKSRVVKSVTLKHLDGVKDVSIGSASVEDRMAGNFKKTGAPADNNTYDDTKAQRDRWGFPF
jgi:hypothetical protein